MTRRYKAKLLDPKTKRIPDTFHTGVKQSTNDYAAQYRKIDLPKEEPNPDQPLNWFSAYERHAGRD